MLAAFHKLTGDSVVWDPDSRCWRMRIRTMGRADGSTKVTACQWLTLIPLSA